MKKNVPATIYNYMCIKVHCAPGKVSVCLAVYDSLSKDIAEWTHYTSSNVLMDTLQKYGVMSFFNIGNFE